MDATTIAAAALSDAPQIAALSGELGYPITPAQAAARLAAILADPDSALLVTRADGIVTGWIHLATRCYLSDGLVTEVCGLVVGEAWRGQGCSRRLMAAAEEWARARGCAAVRLRSNVIRERAHAFYRGLGYELTKTSYNFVKRLTGKTPHSN